LGEKRYELLIRSAQVNVGYPVFLFGAFRKWRPSASWWPPYILGLSAEALRPRDGKTTVISMAVMDRTYRSRFCGILEVASGRRIGFAGARSGGQPPPAIGALGYVY